MYDFLAEMYPWIKSLHIISVIAWMAGMFYLPRLYVYHADAEIGSDKSETFKIMERRLLRGIINPAMIMTFLFGGLLLLTPGIIYWGDIWIWLKLALVFLMGGFHGELSKWRKQFEADRNTRPAKFYRMVNEIPTILVIGIVILVVVKPF
ncbi:MAG: TIGR00701 family protein [Sneathiella sp.]|jgi:putative membrane protein|uniref:protoporphyrinogen oxidase HemJ n=1 Tax=Sneathiella sp. TaxID=1964365 RepID=UPI000C38900E|nr:protoporphyrinogen oxidase HemJ [Sneathiella sp.]MAL79261.1 TIGR00701 family protein [Sneathiella sp.]|tara:strand:- start:999 stop:1448 length:450 start_codon:yes stop_codon:yes gene_type:complete